MRRIGPREVAERIVQPEEPEDFGKARLALQALDPKLRIPLILKEVEEMSVEEIATNNGNYADQREGSVVSGKKETGCQPWGRKEMNSDIEQFL